MLFTTNLHTHTTRCNHACGEDREYVEKAISAGFTVLGFSDHSPMPFRGDYYSSYRMRIDQVEDYVKSVLSLREEFKGQCELLLGFEAEYYPALFKDFLKLIGDYPIDYLLLGQHFVGNEQGEKHCNRVCQDEAEFARYIDQVIEALETGVFTYVAHPDLMFFEGNEAIFRRHAERMCIAAKQTDTPLEINLLGIRGNRIYPTDRFFSIAAEVGNAVVLGVDAHNPEQFLENDIINSGFDMAARCGVRLISQPQIKRPTL